MEGIRLSSWAGNPVGRTGHKPEPWPVETLPSSINLAFLFPTVQNACIAQPCSLLCLPKSNNSRSCKCPEGVSAHVLPSGEVRCDCPPGYLSKNSTCVKEGEEHAPAFCGYWVGRGNVACALQNTGWDANNMTEHFCSAFKGSEYFACIILVLSLQPTCSVDQYYDPHIAEVVEHGRGQFT